MSGKVSSYFKQQKPNRQDSKQKSQHIEPEPGAAQPNRFELSEVQRVLKAFDLDTKYGPCAGLTRLERWERAQKFNLEPPLEVREILLRYGLESVTNQSIWSE